VCNFVLRLWDEHKPRVFEIRVLWKIFRPERVAVRGVVENEEISVSVLAIYYLDDQIRRNEMGRKVSHIRDRRRASCVLAGKSE